MVFTSFFRSFRCGFPFRCTHINSFRQIYQAAKLPECAGRFFAVCCTYYALPQEAHSCAVWAAFSVGQVICRSVESRNTGECGAEQPLRRRTAPFYRSAAVELLDVLRAVLLGDHAGEPYLVSLLGHDACGKVGDLTEECHVPFEVGVLGQHLAEFKGCLVDVIVAACLRIGQFQILCFAGLFSCLQGVNYFAVAAVGKSGHLLLWTLIKRGTGLLFVVGGLALFGMRGLLGGMVLTSYMIYVVNAVLVHWYVGYKIHMQLLDLLPVILISLLAFAGAFFLGKVLPMNMYLVAALQFLVYVLIYASISYVFKLKALDYFLDIAGLLLQRIGLKKNG